MTEEEKILVSIFRTDQSEDANIVSSLHVIIVLERTLETEKKDDFLTKLRTRLEGAAAPEEK